MRMKSRMKVVTRDQAYLAMGVAGFAFTLVYVASWAWSLCHG